MMEVESSQEAKKIRSFDDILLEYGEFGPYQKFIYILYAYPFALTSMLLMGWTFVGSQLPFRCLASNEANMTTPFTSSLMSLNDRACLDERNQSCKSFVYDTSLIGDSIVKEWDLVCENKEMVARIGSAPMIGYIFGGIIFGTLSDKVGRKYTFLICVSLLILSSGALSFAHNPQVFLYLRFIVGILIPGVETSSYILAIEVVGPSKRTLASIGCWFFESTGLLLTLAFAYHINYSWRLLQAFFTAPLLLLLSYIWIAPESPRWLLSQGKYDKASNIVDKIIKSNKSHKNYCENTLEILKNCQMEEDEEKSHTQHTFVHLYRIPILRQRTLILNWLWIVLASFYYVTLLDQSDLSQNPYLGFLITVAGQLPCYLFLLLTIEKSIFGRKKSLLTLLLIAGISLISFPYIPSVESLSWLRFSLSLIGRLTATSSYTILCLFTTEQYPTVLRGTGLSFNFTMSRFGSILAPYALMMGKYSHIIFGVGAIASAILLTLLSDTLGKKLPDTIEEIESLETHWSSSSCCCCCSQSKKHKLSLNK